MDVIISEGGDTGHWALGDPAHNATCHVMMQGDTAGSLGTHTKDDTAQPHTILAKIWRITNPRCLYMLPLMNT